MTNPQDQSITGDVTENTTPDTPTPGGTSELQTGNVIGAHGEAPSVAGGGESLYEGNTSAVSTEVDRAVEENDDGDR